MNLAKNNHIEFIAKTKGKIKPKKYRLRNKMSEHKEDHIELHGRPPDTENNVNFFSHKTLAKMSKRELASHLAALKTYRASQSLDQVFPCVKCDRSLAFEPDLETHSKTCRGTKPRPLRVEPDHPSLDLDRLCYLTKRKKTFSCQLCQYKTASTTHMRNHLTVHSGQKPHKCEECGKSFSTVCYLNTHKRIHTGFKPYKCEECGYSCNTACNFKRHVTSHGGGTLFACPECDYKTTYSAALERHKRAHLNDMRFSCSVCTFVSVTAQQLRVHVRSHTGERPYHCGLCEYRCSTKSHLIRHGKRHHGVVSVRELTDESTRQKESSISSN